MQHITATELAHWIKDSSRVPPVLLDVRETKEHEICQIPGSTLMPMQNVLEQLSELNPEAPIVCVCHHGMRSRQVAAFLEQSGFTRVMNLTGGIHAWSQSVDLTMPIY